MMQCEKCGNCPFPNNDECVGKSISVCNISKEELVYQIKSILQKLYDEDFYLIKHKVHEACISAHFWRYFFERFHAECYKHLDIDVEYNRDGDWAKYYRISGGGKRQYARPDMIIHKRGCNSHNLACIEFKGYWNSDDSENENDENKLKAFTNQNILFSAEGKKYAYRYKYGIQLKLYEEKVEIKWFENGQYVNCYMWSGR